MSRMGDREKLVTEQKIPGTDVPDVTRAEFESEGQRRWMSRVGVTTAALAACASVATMFSASYLNKAMLEQIVASDQWNFFQAKGVKLAVLESRMELLSALGKPAAETGDPDTAKADRYRKEQAELKAEAESHQALAQIHQKRHTGLAIASTAFQIAIALAAVALLVRKNAFWAGSVAVGLVGVALFAAAMLL